MCITNSDEIHRHCGMIRVLYLSVRSSSMVYHTLSCSLFVCPCVCKVVLSFDVLDMGDIFINSKHVYEVTLLNRGDIAADWTLQAPQTPFARKFQFAPMRGTLDVKDRYDYVQANNVREII